MRLRNFLVLVFIASTTAFISCSGEDVDTATRGESTTDGVTRDTPNANDTQVATNPPVETIPDSIIKKNADCPFLGAWKLIDIEGKELLPAQKDMTLTFFQNGKCEMEGAGKVREGKWNSNDWVVVDIVDPNGPKQQMDIVSIENDEMIFISNGLDKVTVSKVIETPTE